MINLLEETKSIIEENGKSKDEVLWCGSEEFGYFSWEDFILLANREYDNGYGGAHVATDLVIVGDNWWLERHEYDGSEWWEFKKLPKKPLNEIKGQVVGNDTWSTLKEINQPGGKYGLD